MRWGQTSTPCMLRPDTVGHEIKNSTSSGWDEWELATVYIDGATSTIVSEGRSTLP